MFSTFPQECECTIFRIDVRGFDLHFLAEQSPFQIRNNLPFFKPVTAHSYRYNQRESLQRRIRPDYPELNEELF